MKGTDTLRSALRLDISSVVWIQNTPPRCTLVFGGFRIGLLISCGDPPFKDLEFCDRSHRNSPNHASPDAKQSVAQQIQAYPKCSAPIHRLDGEQHSTLWFGSTRKWVPDRGLRLQKKGFGSKKRTRHVACTRTAAKTGTKLKQPSFVF